MAYDVTPTAITPTTVTPTTVTPTIVTPNVVTPTTVTLNSEVAAEGLTISFSETSKGWTSFKSFVQDSGLSLNNDYYTFKNTNAFDAQGNITSSDFLMWKHHNNDTRNNFYKQQYDSHVDVLFNEESATVKSFASMKYEGTQSKITKDLTDPEYFNNEEEKGWYVESGITDLQSAGEMEFKDKEGKWFSYMKGVSVETVEDLNSKEFSFQGVGILDSMVTTGNIYGCMDPLATNYDPTATDDDGSCTYPPYSCWECDGNGNCDEDTNPLNGPCNDYNTEAACLSNCGSGPPPPRYTLTINDSTLSTQQINYNVSTFTKTNIIGDSHIDIQGTGTFPDSEYKLEITPDANHTVRASDFAIEFPNGTASQMVGVGPGNPYGWYSDSYSAGGFSGQGNDLGTGPLVYLVAFEDSENPTSDLGWAGPTAANIVIANCFIGTDMQDNVPGFPSGQNIGGVEGRVYMTDNGMQSTNPINPGIPGDLDIEINIIGSAQQYGAGCTDPYASNYDPLATIDDGSCDYGGCTDGNAINYNPNAMYDDGSCVYPPLCGCTDNTLGINNSTIFSSRPVGYYGPAENVDLNANILCSDDSCDNAPCVSGQTGSGCCCVYDPCNVVVQSLEGSLVTVNSNDGIGNGSCTINLNTTWLPLGSTIYINVYDDGFTATHVPDVITPFWSPTNTVGWGGGGGGVTSSGGGGNFGIRQNDSFLDPTEWNIINDMPPGDYHVSIDTGDGCYVWYDFTIGDDHTPPTSVYGCMDPTAVNYNSTANVDDGSCTYPQLNIGDTHQGGIIFYLDVNNGGGLIAAPSDQGTAEWGCFGTLIAGADSNTDGAQNTIDIINAGCTSTNGNPTAADICANLTLGGYSDWFLPSRTWLNVMYGTIGPGNVMGLGNIGGFTNGEYWSSTEHSKWLAWAQEMQYTFSSQNDYNKSDAKYVRAIRAF